MKIRTRVSGLGGGASRVRSAIERLRERVRAGADAAEKFTSAGRRRFESRREPVAAPRESEER